MPKQEAPEAVKSEKRLRGVATGTCPGEAAGQLGVGGGSRLCCGASASGRMPIKVKTRVLGTPPVARLVGVKRPGHGRVHVHDSPRWVSALPAEPGAVAVS